MRWEPGGPGARRLLGNKKCAIARVVCARRIDADAGLPGTVDACTVTVCVYTVTIYGDHGAKGGEASVSCLRRSLSQRDSNKKKKTRALFLGAGALCGGAPLRFFFGDGLLRPFLCSIQPAL